MNFKAKVEEMSIQEVEKRQIDIMSMLLPPIKFIAYQSSDDNTQIVYEYPELEGVCPMTGLPDNYCLTIKYKPDNFIPELKSLRLYLIAYRDLPILHEYLINKIFQDFCEAIYPLKLWIEIKVAVRGGITTTLIKEM